MQIRSAEFMASARSLAECPAWEVPEFAFIGRSNVGKSSLINLLTNRRALANVSGTPGKTREVNLFLINGQWSLVDLPGYGYAKVSKEAKFAFNELAGDYLEGRKNLRRVFVLIDCRHPPQRLDLDFTAWLATTGAKFSFIFTKTDKQSAGRTQENVDLFLAAIAPTLDFVPVVLTASATTRAGRDDILRAIGQELA